MKEIDFLPQWYKESRRHQLSVRRQYIVLTVIFGAMMTYNLLATHSISKAAVELSRAEAARAEAENTLYELNNTRNQIAQLQKKVKVVAEIDSKIDVAAVLAELSFLIDKNIVLSRIEFLSEPITKPNKEEQREISAVRLAGAAGKSQDLLGDVRFKITISGVAADQSNVAALVCTLEDSPYFHQVYPSISRNTKLQLSPKALPEFPKADAEGTVVKVPDVLGVSEFEISCYLANYKEVKG